MGATISYGPRRVPLAMVTGDSDYRRRTALWLLPPHGNRERKRRLTAGGGVDQKSLAVGSNVVFVHVVAGGPELAGEHPLRHAGFESRSRVNRHSHDVAVGRVVVELFFVGTPAR